jgi:hypothetical protein
VSSGSSPRHHCEVSTALLPAAVETSSKNLAEVAAGKVRYGQESSSAICHCPSRRVAPPYPSIARTGIWAGCGYWAPCPVAARHRHFWAAASLPLLPRSKRMILVRCAQGRLPPLLDPAVVVCLLAASRKWHDWTRT